MAPRAIKTPVAMRSLIARINRKLAPQGMRLKTARGERVRQSVGDYYVIDTRLNVVVHRYRDCSPEDVARELGVLKPYEQVVED
jgi:hypothetical protein